MDAEDLRLAIYDSFARTGGAPQELDPVLLDELAQQRHVVLDAAGALVMAHPFSAIPLGFSVMSHDTLWWGGCCWDSFAIAHLLRTSVLVATRCPACDAARAWVVAPEAPPEGNQLAHFLVPAREMWRDVVHTCGNQRIFCSQSCIDVWLELTDNRPGYVMDLATLWRLASGWYAGRLERGYRRREPSQAQAYFESVGLHGEFWGVS